MRKYLNNEPASLMTQTVACVIAVHARYGTQWSIVRPVILLLVFCASLVHGICYRVAHTFIRIALHSAESDGYENIALRIHRSNRKC